MKKYRTLFYVSKWGDGHIADNLIALATQLGHIGLFFSPNRILWDTVKSGYSHEEIWTPDEDGQFSISDCKYCGSLRWYPRAYNDYVDKECDARFNQNYLGICYTSTMGQVRGGNNVGRGTCKRDASLILKHPGRWSYTEHLVSDDAYAFMIEYLEKQVAENKGYGLGPDKNICSEISHNANVVSGELAGPFKVVTPIGDALSMVRSGKKIIPLK